MTIEELKNIAQFWYWQGVEGCECPPSFAERWKQHEEGYKLALELQELAAEKTSK